MVATVLQSARNYNMITFIDNHEILSHVCKATGKWGMLISFAIPSIEDCDDPYGEITKAAPYLTFDNNAQIIGDGIGYILADTREEIYNLYNQTVGDDGPTKLNSYKGLVKVYALTCDSNGNFLSENT